MENLSLISVIIVDTQVRRQSHHYLLFQFFKLTSDFLMYWVHITVVVAGPVLVEAGLAGPRG